MLSKFRGFVIICSGFCHLSFDIHLTFELWHLKFKIEYFILAAPFRGKWRSRLLGVGSLFFQTKQIPPRQSQLSGSQNSAKDFAADGLGYFIQKGDLLYNNVGGEVGL